MRWDRCIYHRGYHTEDFLSAYLADAHRRALLVAGAGFDPRAIVGTEALARHAAGRLRGCFIREERPGPAATLVARANAHEGTLSQLVPDSSINRVDIFAPDN